MVRKLTYTCPAKNVDFTADVVEQYEFGYELFVHDSSHPKGGYRLLIGINDPSLR